MPLQRRNDAASTFRNLDWATIAIYIIMVFAGMVSIYAASYDFDNASMLSFDEFSGKQLRWILLSFGIGIILLLVDTRMYETYAYPIYVVLVILLAITPVIAPDIKGSHSWLKLGPVSLQPAEFAKFATALALAKLFSSYHFDLNAKASNYFRALIIIFIPIVLILLQNETGSALTFLALFFVLYREGMSGLVLFAALFSVVIFVVAIKYTESTVMGMETGTFAVLLLIQAVMVGMTAIHARCLETGRNLLLGFIAIGIIEAVLSLCGVGVPGLIVNIAAIAAACIYAAIEAIRYRRPKLYVTCATALLALTFLFSVGAVFDNLKYHQKLRIQVALGIVEDLRNAGYNVNQSKIAIGSGGWFGKGFLEGTQIKYGFVPERHTDFIFCTVGEEWGFLGTLTVLTLLCLLILRLMRMGERQQEPFGRIYCYCVAAILLFHVLVNVGMTIGLMPVMGIPLPFMSYGGSSLIAFTILLFIAVRLDASTRQFSPDKF